MIGVLEMTSHSNARRRALMMEDLESFHSALLDAYKPVLALRGIDLDALADMELPTRHVPI